MTRRIGMLTVALAGFVAGQAVAATTPQWSVPFESSGPMRLSKDTGVRLLKHPAAAGLFIQASNALGTSASRSTVGKVDATGSAAWLAQDRFIGRTLGVVPLSDGSTVVIGSHISRYAADGRLLWSTPQFPSVLASPQLVEAGDLLVVVENRVVGGGALVRTLDRDTGHTLDKLDGEFPVAWDYRGAGMVAVGDHSAYWLNAATQEITRIGLAPLRVEWTAVHPFAGFATSESIVADDTGAYVVSTQGTVKYSQQDGAVAWVSSTALDVVQKVVINENQPNDLLIADGGSVRALARHNGSELWRHEAPALIRGMSSDGDDIVLAGNMTPDWLSTEPGFIQRLNRSDGSLTWQLPVEPAAGAIAAVTDVAIEDGRVVVAGLHCASDQQPDLCEARLWHAALNGGPVALVTPRFTLPVSSALSVVGVDSTVAAALVEAEGGPGILVKKIDNDDGAVLWSSTLSAILPNAPGLNPYGILLQRVGDANGDVVVTLYRRTQSLFRPNSSDWVVFKLSGTDGAVRWQRSLLDTDAGYTDIAASPLAIDSVGNVFATVHEAELFPVPQPNPRNRSELRRYASDDGAALVLATFAAPENVSVLAPPDLAGVGNTLLVGATPLGQSTIGTIGMDGSTGNVLWSSTDIWVRSRLLDEGEAAFTSRSSYSQTPMRTSRFDPLTGNESWATTYAGAGDLGIDPNWVLRGSGQHVIVGSQARVLVGGSTSQWVYRPLIMRFDDSSGAIDWVNRFDINPVPGAITPQPLPGLSAGFQIAQSGAIRSLTSGRFITRINEDDGAFGGTELLAMADGDLQQLPYTAVTPKRRLDDGGLVVEMYHDEPGAPSRFVVEKWPARTVSAGGSLKARFDGAVATEGFDLVGSLRFTGINDGTIAANNVEVIVSLPGATRIGSATCQVDGVPCIVERAPAYLRFFGDLQPGSRVTIDSTVSTSNTFQQRPTPIIGTVFSSDGLVEMDMKDNVASFDVHDRILVNGFD